MPARPDRKHIRKTPQNLNPAGVYYTRSEFKLNIQWFWKDKDNKYTKNKMFLASDLRFHFRICIQENKQNSLTD